MLLVHGSRPRADSFRRNPARRGAQKEASDPDEMQACKGARNKLPIFAVCVSRWYARLAPRLPLSAEGHQMDRRHLSRTGHCLLRLPEIPKASIEIRFAEHHRLAAALARLALEEPSDKPRVPGRRRLKPLQF